MIILAMALIGAVVGVFQAKRRNGNRLDLWQYGGVYAILFSIVGVFLTLVIERLV
jgi:hypothetical protein